MAEVIFSYEEKNITIQCNLNDKMKDIINEFLKQTEIDGNDDLYFLYKDNQINFDLTFSEQINKYDKNDKTMNIKVNKKNKNEKKEILSKDVICPECKENIFINFQDFKINLNGCKNNHNINKILLDKYEEIQKINLSQIMCDICNKNNFNTNELYTCNTCNQTVCPICVKTQQ